MASGARTPTSCTCAARSRRRPRRTRRRSPSLRRPASPVSLLLVWLVVRRAGDGVPANRSRVRRDGPARVRTSLGRDPRALPLLQRALRRPDVLGPARARRRRRARAGAWRRRGHRMIGVGRARARARAAHRRRRVRLRRHDGAARRSGADVRYVAFSIATRSLPEGFAPDTLAREVREATAEIGIPAGNLTVHDFDVRTFPDHRQEILELLIEIWNDWKPDCVFMPSHPRRAPGSPDDRERGAARVQAHDDPRLRDPVEQLRLQLPGVYRARDERTSSGRSLRSRSTRRSSTAATRTPSTSGTWRARTAST